MEGEQQKNAQKTNISVAESNLIDCQPVRLLMSLLLHKSCSRVERMMKYVSLADITVWPGGNRERP